MVSAWKMTDTASWPRWGGVDGPGRPVGRLNRDLERESQSHGQGRLEEEGCPRQRGSDGPDQGPGGRASAWLVTEDGQRSASWREGSRGAAGPVGRGKECGF